MTLNELKTKAAAMGITPDMARNFGHLGHKATWQAAIDKMSEAVALAADAANEAQQPAQATAEAVTEVVYSDTSRAIFYAVMRFVAVLVITIFLVAGRIAQITWDATQPLRHRASKRIHSELWAAIGPWPDLLFGL
jgi:negative regulator of replication initiation